MNRFLIFFWSLLPFLSPAVLAAEELGSLEDICVYARQNSLDYQTALWDAVKASNDIDGIWEMEETSFDFGTSVESDDDPSASAEVEVPLLDQISLNSSVDSSETREFGLTLSPLVHSDDRIQQNLSWQKAAASAEQMGISAENSAIIAVLDWLSVKRSVEVQAALTVVQETIYRDEKVRYEAGESTLDDVRTALIDWTDAGKSLSSLQNDQRSTELALIAALNAEPGTLSLPDLDSGELEVALADLQENINFESADPSQSYAVLASLVDVRSLEEEWEDTWLFDPDLSLTGGVETDSGGESTWSGTLSLSFSLQDFQKEDKTELARDLELSRLEAAQILTETRMSLQQDLISIENTAQSTELARLELEEAREIYEEAEFLLEQGEYSVAERDEASLDLKAAEVSLFAALSDEYGAWRELLFYFPAY